MKKRFLITGSTGFLGKALLIRLCKEVHDVSVIVRESTDVSVIDSISTDIKVFNVDHISIDNIVQQCEPNIVIHCAVAYGRKENVEQVFKTNVNMFVELLAASVRYGVEHFINTDTFSGKDEKYEYLKAYHLSKRTALQWAHLIMENSHIKFSNMRLEHIYGPNDNADKFFPYMLDSLLANKDCIELTAGEQKRDFVHVDDVVNSYFIVVNHQVQKYCEYEVGTGVSTSIKDLLLLMKSLIPNNTTDLKFGALPTRKGEFRESKANLTNLSEIGYCSSINLTQGIGGMIKNQSV